MRKGILNAIKNNVASCWGKKMWLNDDFFSRNKYFN